MEELFKANEREYQRLNIPAGTPDTHKSSMFQCTSHIWARITPFTVTSLYFLDFVDNNGSRIEGRTGLIVFDGQESERGRYAMEPTGRLRGPGRDVPNCELEIYLLHPARLYEIRPRGTQQLLKTITFPVTITVQCI